VLITDGKSAVGQALAKALVEAGAGIVWLGIAEPWKQGADTLALPQLERVPLDVTDEKSVRDLAGVIGGKVDILINTAELHRNHTIADRGTETARAEMEVNYLGLMRLAQAFGPAMRARAAEGAMPATAWVNLLSVYALSALPSHGTYSASKAAALALSQNLRAEMRHAGIRVVNAFPGSIDDEWNQLVPPPKLAPAALAKAIVAALRDGVEDVYPGDVAQDLIARFRESQKVLERELWDQ
jgi:NAD(P)-dependent dehydrogenase (short-subunit alcohol dehydrogenase family)